MTETNASSARQVIWLTGASSGIGRATAIELGRRGYRLALTARRVELLDELRNYIISAGATAEQIAVFPADVTNIDQVKSVYAQICKLFGRVDILFANAGGHLPSTSSRFETAEYKKLFELNLFGVLNCIEAVLPDMRANHAGHIVGVSSVAGYRALPTAAAYGASKSALTYFLNSLRFDLERDGIAVTVVSPGFVRTPLTDLNTFPMPCLIEPEVAAKAIADGIERRALEIHFPKRFTLFLKLLGLLPYPAYQALIRRFVVR